MKKFCEDYGCFFLLLFILLQIKKASTVVYFVTLWVSEWRVVNQSECLLVWLEEKDLDRVGWTSLKICGRLDIEWEDEGMGVF